MSFRVETLCKNLCRIGEGPCWDAPNQRLLFVDIPKVTVHRWDYNTGKLQTPIVLPEQYPYVSAAVPRESGGLAIAAYHSFLHLNETNNSIATLATVQKDSDQTTLNDGKCDPAGRFWAGTGYLSNATPTQRGVLVTLDTNQTVETKLENVSLSNGLSWSPDGQTMYFIDTPTYTMKSYRFDVADGSISNEQVFAQFDKWLDGTPDGQCNDADGNLWVAMFGGGRVIKVDGETGQKVQRLPISASALRTTSCCFGGPGMDELFVTSGSSEMDKVGDAGSLFKITGLGVKGRESVPYRG